MSSRQRAIQQSQKMAGQGTGQVGQNRDLVSSIKGLNSSIQKLIASNKSLEASVKASSRGGGGGGGQPGGGGRVPRLGGSAGFGGMGASLPIVGAAVAGIGFAIQKINQIGNAYIDLVSQQAGTVGVGGMRGGRRGMYLQTELGAMEKAHRMAGGRFGGTGQAVSDRAVQVGTIFGMGAEEVGRISGQFSRGGANLTRATSVAAGTGIETEMPLFLQGMASIMEEAVTQGINSSNLADDLGDQIAMLTRINPTQSVGMATNIVRSLRGVQQQVSGGQIGGLQQFMAYRATGGAINQRLSDPARREEYLRDLTSRGLLDQSEVTAATARATAAGRSVTLEDLNAINPSIGPTLRREMAGRGTAEVNAGIIEEQKRVMGGGAAGLRRTIALNPGMSINEQAAAWQGMGQRVPQGAEAAGAAAIQSRAGAAEGSSALTGIARTAQRQGLVMEHGAAFADVSLKMEQSMISVVRAIAPVAESALPALGNAVVSLSTKITELTTKLQQADSAGGGVRAVGSWLFNLIAAPMPNR